MNNKGIFRIYPLVPVALCLVSGIISGQWLIAYADSTIWIAAVVVLSAISVLLFRFPVFQSYAILVTSFFIGCALISVAERNYRVQLPCGAIQYEAVVVTEPVERGKTVRFDMIISSGPLSGRTVRASLLKDTVTGRYAALGVGDGLTAYSVMKPPKNFVDSNFDYVTYLKAHDVTAQTFIFYRNWRKASVSMSRLTVWQRSRLSFMRMRHKIMEKYRNIGLDGDNFAVVSAMTLGHRSDISSELRATYSAAGVSHVLALSGMHLSIIYLLFSLLFVGLRFAVLREALLVVSIWFYVFMVGMPPSVVRSAIMISVYSIVGLTGRDRMSLNVLAFAALLMLVANPFCLYDVGFQLSFISVAAILIANRNIANIVSRSFLQRHRILNWLWNLLVMSCSAQLATAPLVAYYFGTVPTYFLIANIVVVPVVTIILYLSALTLALFFIPVIQKMAVMLLVFTVGSLNTFLKMVSSLPGAVITGVHINAVQLLAVYVVIISLCLLCHRIFFKRRASF